MVNKNIVPVVFITDDNYIIPTSVAITSLISNKDQNTFYHIYIISPHLSNDNKIKYGLFNSEDVKISIIETDFSKYQNLHKYKSKNNYCVASPSALLKFELPNLIDKYDKVIYLDGDILVKKDLKVLFDINIQDVYVAASYDTGRLYSSNEKFKIYPQYFNSGVMLLNLKLMRENCITEKLYNAKKNSKDMDLMDQNIFNEICKGMIKNIDISFNFLTINLHRAINKYNISDINNLFRTNYLSLDDIDTKAYIVHFASKDKPWKYYNGLYSKEWFEYFKKSPVKDFNLVRLNSKKETEVIISLTSYPARINTVNQVIESLLNQTMKADKVILWLAPEQFPNGEADLPKQLLDLKEKGLIIDWYKDIKSYKKLIPTLKKYPEAIIVTADDDIIYPNNWLEKLYKSYKENPECIHANRAHYFTYNKDCIRYKGFINSDKLKNRKYKNFSLLPTTGGGILYPPNVLNNNVFDEEKAFKLCKDCDDIWFWINALLNKTKIILIPNRIKYIHKKAIPETQTVSLYKYNCQEGGGNDIALKNIFTEYPDLLTILKKEIPFYKPILDFFIRKKIVNNTVKIKLFNFIPLYKRQKSGNNYTKKFYLFGLQTLVLRKQNGKRIAKIFGLSFAYEHIGATYRVWILGIKFQHTNKYKNLMLHISALQYHVKTLKSMEKTLGSVRSDMNNNFGVINERLLSVVNFKKALEIWYRSRTGHRLALENPKSFNEKIQWMKLYDSTPIKTRLADKYLVRDWVKEKIGEEYLIPLLGVYDKFEDIDFDKLPNQFVIKCNHGSGYNIIVRDKSQLDLLDAKNKINKWMRENYAYRLGYELHYRDIDPKIIIEKYIENAGTNDLYDYKFWCFDGKVYYIQFLSERNLSGLKMAFYDINWIKQTFAYDHPVDIKNIEKPNNLNEMIKLAEKLSKGFNHVRVDFYRMNDGKLYFGEMTFTSATGCQKWSDEKINEYFGSLIKLPSKIYDLDTKEFKEIK